MARALAPKLRFEWLGYSFVKLVVNSRGLEVKNTESYRDNSSSIGGSYCLFGLHAFCSFGCPFILYNHALTIVIVTIISFFSVPKKLTTECLVNFPVMRQN